METVIERNNVVLTDSPASQGISAVAWPAVFAGAVAAAAMSLILFVLGIGLGLGALSPWAGEGIGGTAFGISTILWITLTSLVASAVGGYLTGRLRTRWLAVHTDEVYFRDTAHGFLAWGVATLITAVIFTTTTVGAISMGAQVAGGVAETAATAAVAGVAAGDEQPGAMASRITPKDSAVSYYLDSLFRPGMTTATPVVALQAQPATTNDGAVKAPAGAAQQQGTQAQQQAAAATASTEAGAKSLTPPQQAALATGGASPDTTPAPLAPQGARNRGFLAPQGAPMAMPEVSRIFTRAISQDQLADADADYIGRLVAQHTGLTEAEASARVNDVFARTQAELGQMETKAREAADEARAVGAKTALWFFVALLIGAFTGSYSATIGGRQRDF